jgi:NADH-quinone oxidoreductase subunit J
MATQLMATQLMSSNLLSALQPVVDVGARVPRTAPTGFDWSGPQILFWIIAFLTVAGAISTVTRKNNIAAVMSLVATFFGLAALYAMLSAHFVAVLQVLVYAGAIMTLFVFVIMVLNRDEAEPWRISIGQVIGAGALVYTVVVLGYHLFAVAPRAQEMPPASFGTVAEVGNILFTDYLFVFEAVSVLLLIAVIAAVVVARSAKQVEHDAAGPINPSGDTSHVHAQSGGTPPGDHH